ncbi:MAG: hypothetical protein H7A50_06810 [Akkermansiaceae bacterium]|nr:hypothetical protein [Akkermansiaceae bacterium]
MSFPPAGEFELLNSTILVPPVPPVDLIFTLSTVPLATHGEKGLFRSCRC